MTISAILDYGKAGYKFHLHKAVTDSVLKGLGNGMATCATEKTARTRCFTNEEPTRY